MGGNINAHFNAAENAKYNEGYQSVESTTNIISQSTTTKLNAILEESDNNLEDSVKSLSEFKQNINKIFTDMNKEIFNTHKLILQQNNKYNGDADVHSSEAYKAEIAVAEESKKKILGEIDAKIEEFNKLIATQTEFDQFTQGEGKIKSGISDGRFHKIDHVKRWLKENNLTTNITWGELLNRFELGQKLRNQINKKIENGTVNKDDIIK